MEYYQCSDLSLCSKKFSSAQLWPCMTILFFSSVPYPLSLSILTSFCHIHIHIGMASTLWLLSRSLRCCLLPPWLYSHSLCCCNCKCTAAVAGSWNSRCHFQHAVRQLMQPLEANNQSSQWSGSSSCRSTDCI